MRKTILTTVLVTFAIVVCMVAACFCSFYYIRYKTNVTELETRINGFDMRLATLEGHKSRELTPVHVWGVISTTDRAEEGSVRPYLSSTTKPEGFFEAINAKGGALIRPELRLPAGATTNCEYEIHLESQFGGITDAWLSHAEPYQALVGFEEFRVYVPYNSNTIKLIARPKAGASIQMRFDVVVLCLK